MGVKISEMPAAPKGGFYLPALDGIRGLAFLLVFLLHALSASYMGVELSGANPFVRGALDFGRYGVSLFFVLSAFLVTSLLLRERERLGSVDVGAFIVRRGLRIWPLYSALVLLYFAKGRLIPFTGTPILPLGLFAAYGTFMGDVFHMFNAFGALTHLWSIGVEEKFYFAWPWVLRRASRETIARIVVGVVVLQWGLRFALAPHVPMTWFLYGPLGYLDCFALGAGAAILNPRMRIPKISPLPALAIFLGVIWLGTVIGFAIDGPTQEGLGLPISQGTAALASVILIVVLKDGLSGWVTWRPLIEVGKRSYGAYLFHAPLLGATARLAPPGLSVRSILVRLAVLALTIGLSFLSYRFFERPFLRLKERFQRVPSGAASTD